MTILGKSDDCSYNLSGSEVCKAFRKGESIYYQSQRASSILILKSGKIKIERYTNDGRTVPIKAVRPGEMFGELSILNGSYFANAVCELDSTVQYYPIPLLNQAIERQPEIIHLLLNTALKDVQSLVHILEIRTIRSAKDRILNYLNLLKADKDLYIHLDCSYKDIAEQIGLTPEAMYRGLAKLEREGLISRSGSTIRSNTHSDNDWINW